MPLIKLFFDICLLRKGPQDAPASITLLQVSMGAYFLVGLSIMLLETDLLSALEQVFLEAAMLLAFIWISLRAAGKMSRFLQTTIAMTGTDALISSFAVPLVGLVMANPQLFVIHLILLLLMLWHMTVVAHILRHALSQTLAVGFGLSIVFLLFTYRVMMILFGPATP